MAVLMLAAWIASGWYMLSIRRTSGGVTRSIEVAVGRVSWSSVSPPSSPPDVQLLRLMRWYGWRWRFEAGNAAAPGLAYQSYSAPLWPAFIVATGPAVVLWWGDRRLARLKAGGCLACGYDRRGLGAHAKCPECGTVPV